MTLLGFPEHSAASTWRDSANGTITYWRTGKGRSLLLLHGLLGGAFCWRMNVRALSEIREVIPVELGANHNGSKLGMQSSAEALLRFAESLDLKDFDLLGSSWGGGVALMMASRSQAVRRLALAAPVNPYSNFGSRRIGFFASKAGALALRCLLPWSHPVHGIALRRMYGDPSRIPSGTLTGYRQHAVAAGRATAVVSMLRCWAEDMALLRPAIPRITARTLLIWGTRDGAVDIHSAAALQAQIPACRTELIQGAGHLPFEECPEHFNRLLLDFLA